MPFFSPDFTGHFEFNMYVLFADLWRQSIWQNVLGDTRICCAQLFWWCEWCHFHVRTIICYRVGGGSFAIIFLIGSCEATNANSIVDIFGGFRSFPGFDPFDFTVCLMTHNYFYIHFSVSSH